MPGFVKTVLSQVASARVTDMMAHIYIPFYLRLV